MANHPSTPPPSTRPCPVALTPEQVRRTEENRLRAKALRTQQEANAHATISNDPILEGTTSGFSAGQKRPFSSIVSTRSYESTVRDARQPSITPAAAAGSSRPHDDIQAARKFTKYVEYDFSKMTDTRGGFLTADDDPHNKALHAPNAEDKPAHMTLKEWERHQLLKRLREQKSGPFEPGLSVMKNDSASGCRECGSLEIDWKWHEIFDCRICNTCREKFPDKYSLLTKTEARTDYLLTDPELKDPELLPHMDRPNPHKASYHNMQLYLRYQVEAYAFPRWGGPEGLDKEYERRQVEAKRQKEKKFAMKLMDLKKKTRVEAHQRRRGVGGGPDAQFGDVIKSRGDKHEHEWGRTLENAEGMGVKKCVECGMEVEELVF